MILLQYKSNTGRFMGIFWLGGRGDGVGVNFLHEKITQCPNVLSGTQIKTFKILTADDTALVKSSRIIWRLAYQVTSLNRLDVVKSKSYYKKKLFLPWHCSKMLSGHNVQRNICVSRWTIWKCYRSCVLFETSFSVPLKHSKNVRHC